jgi:HK97 family phage portal protein
MQVPDMVYSSGKTMIRKPSAIQRARVAWNVFRYGFPRSPMARPASKQAPFMWPAWREGQAQWQIVDMQSYIDEGFNLNTLIYSAIMYKARAMASITLRAYTGDPDHPELLPPDHPLSKLVSRPNPSQSWREFQGVQDVYLNLTGNAYTFLERPKRGGLPIAMYPLRPDRMYIIPGSRAIKGFVYVPEGRAARDGIPMLPENISHVKLPNPGDPLEGMGYGLSPISPMAHSADVDNMVTKFLKLFFEKGAVIPGVLKFSVPLSDNVVAEVKERWQEMYGSYENWTDIGVLDQGGEYQRIGMNFDEMSFETQDERNETRILGPFGVPPILIGSRVGLARSTYANYEEARRACWEDTLVPESRLFEDDYQYYLQSDDGGFVAFDYSDVPALRRDTPAMVAAWVQLVTTGVPKNIASEIVGLEMGDLPDGDVVYMPLNLIPMGSGKPALPESNVGAAEAEEDTRQGGAKMLPEPNGKKNGKPRSKKAVGEA